MTKSGSQDPNGNLSEGILPVLAHACHTRILLPRSGSPELSDCLAKVKNPGGSQDLGITKFTKSLIHTAVLRAFTPSEGLKLEEG
jgi:hypothetical protein